MNTTLISDVRRNCRDAMKFLHTITFIWIASAGVLHAQRLSALQNEINHVTKNSKSRQTARITQHHEDTRNRTKPVVTASPRHRSSVISISVNTAEPTKSSQTKSSGPKKLPKSFHKTRKPSKLPKPTRISSKSPGTTMTKSRAREADDLSPAPEKRGAQSGLPASNLAFSDTNLFSPVSLLARNGLSERDFDADSLEMQEMVSSPTSRTSHSSVTRNRDATSRGSEAASQILPFAPPRASARTMTTSYGPTPRLPLEPVSITARRSTTLPSGNKEEGLGTCAVLLSIRSSVPRTVTPPLVTRPTTSATGCQCDRMVAEGMYCGYCSAVISCNKNMGCLNNAYGCSAGGCINYGILDSCYRAAIVGDQVYCPFYW